ncbi:hypothetical protein CROQUDRAFT_107161 [Cronartium quercuum f. sp. fusiforme G11]|uniref:Uncharacterized protein n=1 Tax=Cronartium quercuum f. sp. fusiforme G11 TaxID=708437 RepID=A0A9P6TBL8_9BASI|nr:hypothetical protein CROQUDRAFT_107161 [Cronartium quercuum f. sp. fusiforme G11]
MNTFSFILVFLLFGALTISQPRHRHHIRSGSYPDAQCVATLKKANGQDDKVIYWYKPWEDVYHNWQQSWRAGSAEILNVTLFEGTGKGCRVDFTVDTKICGFVGSFYGINITGVELHRSEPSPLNGSPLQQKPSPVRWTNCGPGLMIHLDF